MFFQGTVFRSGQRETKGDRPIFLGFGTKPYRFIGVLLGEIDGFPW